jgi:hypothetical protein
MWTLLGDPALRLPVRVPTIRLSVKPRSVTPGDTVTVSGTLPQRFANATVHLALERPLGSAPLRIKASPDDHARGAATMLDKNARANDVELESVDVKPRDGQFEGVLEVPEQIPWPRLVVRTVATTTDDRVYGVFTLSVGK